MQSYTEITSDKTLTESRDMLLNNDKTVMSCFSGTSAPTSNLQVGMFFLNTSTLMLYQLTALTPTWKLIFDLTKTATNQEAVNTKAATSHASTATTYGVSSATNYGHAMASSATPIVAGMGAVGTDNGKFVREGHIHPAQTSVTGNAGTATKLATAKNINAVPFDGTTDISLTATTAQAIAGTEDNLLLTPAKLRSGLNASGSAPVYACRAWVNFKGTDTVAINASGNVSSITDNGTGDYIVNFITNMPDANYCVSGSARRVDGNENLMFNLFASTTSLLVSGVRVTTTFSDTSGTHGNAETVCVKIHR